MTFNKISAPSVREIFVRQIENKILSGELKPGDKLPPARELCTIMGVSLATEHMLPITSPTETRRHFFRSSAITAAR